MSDHADVTVKNAEIEVCGGKFRGTLKYYEGVADHFGSLVEDEAITYTNVTVLSSPNIVGFNSDDFEDFFELYYDHFFEALYAAYIEPYYLDRVD